MKKLLLLLIMMLLPMMAMADDSGSCGDNVTYTYVEATHTLTISGTGLMGDYSSDNIPWYNYRTDIVKVIIEEGVTSIGNGAFQSCSGLTSITIPNSVTSVGGSAFKGCSRLTSVHIMDLEAWCKISFEGSLSNPLRYAHHLFINGAEINDLVIPNSVTSIVDYAFFYCSGLTSVSIPNSVTTI